MLNSRSFILGLIIATGLISLPSCKNSSSSFDPISRHIYRMDVNDLDLGPKFFPGLTQRHTAVSKLVENGYSKNNCQDDNFDECFARYFD